MVYYLSWFLEFRSSDKTEWGCLTSAPRCLGPQPEDLKGGTWNHLKAHLLTCLVVDTGGSLESSVLLYMAFSTWPGPSRDVEAECQG